MEVRFLARLNITSFRQLRLRHGLCANPQSGATAIFDWQNRGFQTGLEIAQIVVAAIGFVVVINHFTNPNPQLGGRASDIALVDQSLRTGFR